MLGFLLREHLGDDFLDAQLSRHRLGGTARVARHHHQRDAELLEGLHRFRRCFLDRIGDRDHRGRAAINRRIQGALAFGAQRVCFFGQRLRHAAEAVHEAAAADGDFASRDDALHAFPGDRLEILDRLQSDAMVLGAFHDRLGERMLTRTLEAGDQTQQLAFVATYGDEVDERRLAQGQGPGLVDDQAVDVPQPLDRLGVPEQDAVERALTHGYGDRDRRRQAHRAGAGDDQHGDGVGKRIGEARIRPEIGPGGEGEHGDDDHRLDEIRGDHVSQALHRGARALRLRHHLHDAREQRFGADAVGADHQRALAVDRPAGDPVAGLFRCGDRLSRDHRLVDVRCAFENGAVDGNLFTGTHP